MVRCRVDDIINEQFGELTILHRDENDTRKFVCMCSCGNTTSTTKQRLKNGRTKSCRCMKSTYLADAARKHGSYKEGKNSPEYQSYVAMIHRCYDSKRKGWEYYGGRGISVEDRWIEPSPQGFLNFLQDMGERPEGSSLDRIDSNKNYSKENCRWASARVQGHNKNIAKKSNSTSKYRGVSLRKKTGKFMSRIGNGCGGYEWLGEFDCEIDAAKAYNKRALEIFGDDAVLNEIEST